MLRPRVVGAGLRAVAARERASVTRGDDTLQQGVDVVTDAQGRIAFVHRPSDPADRTSPDALVAVLRRLGRGSGEGLVVSDPESGTSTVEQPS
jgi:hypothetical protein